ncbi:MAG: FG-GAP-like repeat-containing protein, partial [Dehalococcoidia bacterium]
MRRRLSLFMMLTVVILLALLSGFQPPRPALADVAPPSGLHVQGNQLVNGAGLPVRLLGMNRTGPESACIVAGGYGLLGSDNDGPLDAAAIQVMASWHINAVRVPLNADCWLNINGVQAQYGGANYQTALAGYVSRLNQAGLAVILSLHFTAAGQTPAIRQIPMPDRDHSPSFWTQVANAYKGNSSVLFDLYNEPFPNNVRDTTPAWQCWLNGGAACQGLLYDQNGNPMSYTAAGMQELVTAIRGTGATNVILAEGINYGGHLSQWLTYKPNDPTGNLTASWHIYNNTDCLMPCWDTVVASLAQQVPVITGEIGEYDCKHTFIDPLLTWLDTHTISYLAWTWNTYGCDNPSLITAYNGTPTAYGQGYKDHLAVLAAAQASISFAPPNGSPFGAGIYPSSVAVGDFNGNGTLGLVTANLGNNTVSVLSGNGDGSFQPQQVYGICAGPFAVTVGNFSGHGNRDVAVANKDCNNVSVLLGNGDGTLQAQRTYDVGTSPEYITAADLRKNGTQDLIVSNLNDNSVSVLLGNGNGTFQTQHSFPAGGSPLGVAVGDIDGDGRPDLVVASSGSAGVSVLLGTGDGSFQVATTVAAGDNPNAIALADLRGNGKLDIVVANFNAATVTVLLNNGNGTFLAPQSYAVGPNPISLIAGDFNGDGRLDIAVADQGSNSVSVLLGNGDGSFQQQRNFAAGNTPTSVAAGDFNGDGKLDLAVADTGSNSVTVLLNGSAGIPGPGQGFAACAAPNCVGFLSARAPVAAGGQTTATLQVVTPPNGLRAWTIDVSFDPAFLRLVSCTPAGMGECHPAGTSKLELSGSVATALMGSVSLATLNFA